MVRHRHRRGHRRPDRRSPTGATFELNAYRGVIAVWQDPRILLVGRVHQACLRSWEHRKAYRRAIEHLLRDGSVVYQLKVGDDYESVEQNGFHYREKIFADDTCQVLSSDRHDEWAVLEADGPVYFVDGNVLQTIGSGGSLARSAGADTAKLPLIPPGDPTEWTLSTLLESLGILDRYTEVLTGDTSLRVWDFFPAQRILEYSVTAVPPIPSSAITFLRGYASTYVPLDRDADERP